MTNFQKRLELLERIYEQLKREIKLLEERAGKNTADLVVLDQKIEEE